MFRRTWFGAVAAAVGGMLYKVLGQPECDCWGHDRLNEAPQVIDYLNHVKEECIAYQSFDDARVLVKAIKIILRDGQPVEWTPTTRPSCERLTQPPE